MMYQPGGQLCHGTLLKYLNLCTAKTEIFVWYQCVLADFRCICTGMLSYRVYCVAAIKPIEAQAGSC